MGSVITFSVWCVVVVRLTKQQAYHRLQVVVLILPSSMVIVAKHVMKLTHSDRCQPQTELSIIPDVLLDRTLYWFQCR